MMNNLRSNEECKVILENILKVYIRVPDHDVFLSEIKNDRALQEEDAIKASLYENICTVVMQDKHLELVQMGEDELKVQNEVYASKMNEIYLKEEKRLQNLHKKEIFKIAFEAVVLGFLVGMLVNQSTNAISSLTEGAELKAVIICLLTVVIALVFVLANRYKEVTQSVSKILKKFKP